MLSFLSDTSIPRVPKYFENWFSPFPAEYLSQAVCGSVAFVVRVNFAKIVLSHVPKIIELYELGRKIPSVSLIDLVNLPFTYVSI